MIIILIPSLIIASRLQLIKKHEIKFTLQKISNPSYEYNVNGEESLKYNIRLRVLINSH